MHPERFPQSKMTHSPEPWKHQPEPWHIEHERAFDTPDLEDANNRPVRDFRFDPYHHDKIYQQQEANAKRIVACVNACRGVPDEELEDIIKSGLFIECEYESDLRKIMPEWLKQALEMRE